MDTPDNVRERSTNPSSVAASRSQSPTSPESPGIAAAERSNRRAAGPSRDPTTDTVGGGSTAPATPTGPYTFSLTLFCKNTPRQANSEQSRVLCQDDFTVPNEYGLIDILWQMAFRLPADQRPKPWARITRSATSPTEFEANNLTPSVEDSRDAVHYFYLHVKNAANWTSSGATVYRLPGEGIPNSNNTIYPPITATVLANWAEKQDAMIVACYFPMGRYFSSVDEVKAYEAVLNPTPGQESRTGATSVPIATQLAQRAQETWGPFYESEDMHWDSIGSYLASLPELSREQYLNGGPPPLFQYLLRPRPNFTEIQMESMRRGMAFAEDVIKKMEAWKTKLSAMVDAMDAELAHLRASANAIAIMIRPVESDISRSFAAGVGEMLDGDHQRPPGANGEGGD